MYGLRSQCQQFGACVRRDGDGGPCLACSEVCPKDFKGVLSIDNHQCAGRVLCVASLKVTACVVGAFRSHVCSQPKQKKLHLLL